MGKSFNFLFHLELGAQIHTALYARQNPTQYNMS